MMVETRVMGQERVSQALSRIDKALARIEAAAAHAPSAAAGDGAELESLRHAHETLRGKVEGAIGQIDRLLELDGAR
jgi:hypothetical protein